MKYFLKRIHRGCDYRQINEYSCGKSATHELVGPGNDVYGQYCEKHGKIRLEERNAYEAAVKKVEEERRGDY